MLESLKDAVCQANRDLVSYDLVTLTWGNVSGINRESGLVVIKPSGVDYDKMTAADMVVVDLNGAVVEGDLRPSSDTPTHLELYRNFQEIGGIAHSHSLYATTLSQACQEIPCFGTTHADHFNGTIPLTRLLTEAEVNDDYEGNTGTAIVERFKDINPLEMPAVLVAGHAPFSWGETPGKAVENMLVLERVSQMAIDGLKLNAGMQTIPDYILRKHYERKHGPNAYYGQKNKPK